jgi:NAD-dependent SIR2 family protein deacetylase
MRETFTCEGCGKVCGEEYLVRRESEPGNYCKACAAFEKCAACGERLHREKIVFKEDVRNFICEDCEEDYAEVKEYIKPLEL